MERDEPRGIIWLGDTRETVRTLPEEVRREIGGALSIVQWGKTPDNAAPL